MVIKKENKMNKEDVEKIATLRSFVISYYKKLDGGTSPEASVMKQEDVAKFLETLVASMDDLLSPHVNFS
jgi:hypothetical protein|tara:strand:- start:584 stop:793 length:210 start_codon:yes stop_codon:yes gene_type:complete